MYGIQNCNTVKKACVWLEEHHKSFEFHNYKKEGISESILNEWIQKAGVEQLLNKRGTTWKKLDAGQKESINDQKALVIMLDNPSIIKRPVLVLNDGGIIVGFSEAIYQDIK